MAAAFDRVLCLCVDCGGSLKIRDGRHSMQLRCPRCSSTRILNDPRTIAWMIESYALLARSEDQRTARYAAQNARAVAAVGPPIVAAAARRNLPICDFAGCVQVRVQGSRRCFDHY